MADVLLFEGKKGEFVMSFPIYVSLQIPLRQHVSSSTQNSVHETERSIQTKVGEDDVNSFIIYTFSSLYAVLKYILLSQELISIQIVNLYK